MNRRDFLTGAVTGVVVGAGGTYAVMQGVRQAEMVAEAPAQSQAPTAPAVNTGIRELKMVTTWPKDFPGLGTGAQRVADRITAMTGGKISVKLYAAGELVPPFESFDAVSNGTADIYHGAEYYWQGKNKAFNFFTTVPLGYTALELNGWIHFGGGQELWDELAGGFNIKPLMAGNTGVQMGGWFTKEINTVEDLKGLKMRIPGLGGEVLRRLGVSAVALPGGEIFPALQSGAIDATEWVGPWNDLAFGFYKVTKFYYYPGFHEPGSGLSLGINKGVWDSFTKEEQEMVTAAAWSENDIMMAEFFARNGDALDTLVNEHGVQLRKFSPEIFGAIVKSSVEVVNEVGAADDIGRRVLESYNSFNKKVTRWTELSEAAYANHRAQSQS